MPHPPRRPRRTEPAPGVIGAGSRSGLPTVGTSLNAPVLRVPEAPSIEVERGLPFGSSNPGATAPHLGAYSDPAAGGTTRPGAAVPTHAQPFTLRSR